MEAFVAYFDLLPQN